MKRRVLCLAVILATMAAGCGAGETSQEQSAAATAAPHFKTASEIIAEAEARSQTEIVSSQAEAFGRVVGEYIFQSPDLAEEYRPTLTLLPDGTAFFRPNLFSAMGELFATYTVDGNTVRMTVTELNFDGFAGDNVTELVFDITWDGALELAYTVPDTEIGVNKAGDRFILK